MATTITTPLMNLTLPVPGPSGQVGPTWAENLNSSLTLIDSHTHASGSGAKITPAAININSDLSMGSFNLSSINSLRLNNQSSALVGASDVRCLYAAGGELYYNDSAGTAIQLTSGGAINVASLGAITGDYSSSGASLSYNNTTKAYTFAQGTPNTTTVAQVSCGKVTIAEQIVSGNGVTLQCPAAFASSYSLTLPAALPASTSAITVSAAGVMATSTFDDIGVSMTATGADAIASAMSSVGANSVAATRTRPTGASVGAGGVAISSGSGTASTTSTSLVDVTNLSVTITTDGRPVKLQVVANSAPSTGQIGVENLAANNAGGSFSFLRGASEIASFALDSTAAGATTVSLNVPPGALSFVDDVAAGTYTYKVQYKANSGSTIRATRVKLIAYEL